MKEAFQKGGVNCALHICIKNEKELRENLIPDGVKFKSETDTEVACAVINKYYEQDPIAAGISFFISTPSL